MLYYYILAGVLAAVFYFKSHTIPTDTPVFIMFHSPHCGYCVQAMPEFKRLGGYITTASGKTVNTLAINGDTNRDAAARFGVQAYPTFVLVNGDKHVTYEGGERTAAAFRDFVQKSL